MFKKVNLLIHLFLFVLYNHLPILRKPENYMRQLLTSFLFVFLTANCNAKTTQEIAVQTNINQDQTTKNEIYIPYGLTSTTVDGELDNLSYIYRKGSKLVFKNKQYQHIFNKQFNKYWLKVAGNHIYIFTWVKFLYGDKDGKKNQYIRGKTLFVTSSSDGGKTFGERVIVNKADGILPDIDIVADKQGHISVIYADERYPGHQVFINSSQDGGKTWLKDDIMLNNAKMEKGKYKRTIATSPGLGKIGNKLIAIWQEVIFNKNKAITKFLSKESTDFGKSWVNQKIIFEGENIPSTEIKSFYFDNEMYLAAAFTKKNAKGLKLFYLTDKQARWNTVEGVAPNSNNVKLVSYIKPAASSNTLFISYIAVNDRNIWHTEVTRLNRKNKSWYQNYTRLDNSVDGTANEIKSGYQGIATLEDGTVIIAWEDYRGILPAVFLNYSTDNGETWLAEPLPLIKVGIQQAYKPFFKYQSNQFKLFYAQSDLPEGKKPNAKMVIKSLKSPKLTKNFKNQFPVWKKPNKDEAKKEIMKKTKEVLEARIKGNWENEWKHLDPLYRNLYSKSSWLLTRGQIKFKKYKIDDIVFLRGVYAYVSGKVTFDFSDKLEGLIQDVPENKKKNIEQGLSLRWGWFYDQWYLIPFTGLENPHIE